MKSRNRKGAFSVFGCCISVFWAGFLAFGYPGMMGTHWREIYHVGAAQTGAVVTFMLFALACGMFFSGRVHMKLGMRKCILVGTLFNIAAMIVLMNAKSIGGVYAWGFITNLGSSFTYGPALTTAQQWFPHRTGVASGVVNFVFGMAAAAMSPVFKTVMGAAGYGKMNVILLVCIVATNLIAMIFAESVEKTRLTDEEKAAHRELLARAGAGEKGDSGNDLTVKQTLKTKDFWIIWVVWIFMGAAGISMVSLSEGYALSIGLSGIVVLSAFNLVNGGSRIVAGLMCDVIGGERTAVIAYVLTAAGYGMLPFMRSVAGASISAACIGFGMGTLFTVTGPVAAKRFGLKYFGMIYGLIFTAYGFIGGILGPALSGVVLDKTGGSYGIVFGYLAVFALIGAGLMIVLARTGGRCKTR